MGVELRSGVISRSHSVKLARNVDGVDSARLAYFIIFPGAGRAMERRPRGYSLFKVGDFCFDVKLKQLISV